MRNKKIIMLTLIMVCITALASYSMLSFNKKPVVIADPVISFAVSSYDVSNISVLYEENIIVARIYNNGNIPLNVSAVWIGDEVSLSINPSLVLLDAGESIQVSVCINQLLSGFYYGFIEFIPVAVSEIIGNPICAGGSVYCGFKVN